MVQGQRDGVRMRPADHASTLSTPFDPRVPPAWARDLVIYEINPRAFTSPDGAGDGSGSGTFRSTKERLPYLRDLGVNSICMAGHHLATRHVYGLWTVYAVLDPENIATVTELLRAREAGLRWVKVFPAASVGPSWFSAIKSVVNLCLTLRCRQSTIDA